MGRRGEKETVPTISHFWAAYYGAMSASPAAFCANIINPILALLLLAIPFLTRKGSLAPSFWLASAAGMIVGTFLAERGKAHQIWPGHPGFPSGHETFGIAAGVSLICWDRRWAFMVVPILILLGGALITVKYHDLPDVLGATVTGTVPALFFQAIRRTLRKSSRPG